MQHVRVGHDQVGVAPDERPFGRRRVAVVHGGPDLRQLQGAHLPQLIAGQGLGREQIQRGALRIGDRLRGEREVVDERLAGGGAGAHDHARAGAERVEGLALMRIEPLDAEQLQPVPHHIREFGERLERWLAGREVLDVHERLRERGVVPQLLEESPRVHLPILRATRQEPAATSCQLRPSRDRR